MNHMNQSPIPLVFCVPCTLLTALLATIIVVLADLQLVDESTVYTRSCTLPLVQRSMLITLMVDQWVRCELLFAPLAAPAPTDEHVV